MSEVIEENRGYAEAGPWDRLGAALRIGVAVLFLLITIAFFATAQNGLVSADQTTGVGVSVSSHAKPIN